MLVSRLLSSPLPDAWQITLILTNVFGVCLFFLLVHFWEKKPLSSVGLKRLSVRELSLGLALIVPAFALANSIVHIGAQLLPMGANNAGGEAALSMDNLSLHVRLVTIAVAAFTEELMMRGFAIERLQHALGSQWLGVTVAYFAALAAHLPFWGIRNVLELAPLVLVLTLIYLWRRDIQAGVIVHAAWDLMAGVLWMMLSPTWQLRLSQFAYPR